MSCSSLKLRWATVQGGDVESTLTRMPTTLKKLLEPNLSTDFYSRYICRFYKLLFFTTNLKILSCFSSQPSADSLSNRMQQQPPHAAAATLILNLNNTRYSRHCAANKRAYQPTTHPAKWCNQTIL